MFVGLLILLKDSIDFDNSTNIAQEINTSEKEIPNMPVAEGQKNEKGTFREIEKEVDEPSPEEIISADQPVTKKSPSKSEKNGYSLKKSMEPEQNISIKSLKTTDSVTEVLLAEEKNEELEDAELNETDIASTQPVEYYIGGVVVYDTVQFAYVEQSQIKGVALSANGRSKGSAKSESVESIENLDEMIPAAQENENDPSDELDKDQKKTNEHFFTLVDQMPQFPGGDEKLIEYLNQNLVYPIQAKQQNIQGTVFISFIIETDGTISSATVKRGIGGGCEEEAKRVVESMPAWQPASRDGKSVRVLFNIPITFKLK